MSDSRPRELASHGVRYGLVGGGLVFAVLVGVHALFQPLALRGFLFFATLALAALGGAPFMLVGPSVVEGDGGGPMHRRSPDAMEHRGGGELQYRVGLPLLAAGAYSLAAFLALGQV